MRRSRSTAYQRSVAGAEADVLIVGLNSDESVRSLKGTGRPVNPERDRAEVLASLSSVDRVEGGD
jgi:bifunctional ADP-heptose synthase (sugar kinase/adenylyltransferase)